MQIICPRCNQTQDAADQELMRRGGCWGTLAYCSTCHTETWHTLADAVTDTVTLPAEE